jgi:hypothetical protein
MTCATPVALSCCAIVAELIVAPNTWPGMRILRVKDYTDRKYDER